ncbi:MAG: glycosyltransferase [Candidatus Levybacteria bacterium]|nr:glycosyltransferase [Candidatus Levybacteria bacterium]
MTEEQLLRYYKSCEALIFPGIEDFGLSMAEAASLGKPIIAYKAGGALEIIREGKTGAFFYPQTRSALKEVLVNFDGLLYKPDDCKKQAELFTMDRFKSQFLSEVKKFI